jgi:hypothetical protein
MVRGAGFENSGEDLMALIGKYWKGLVASLIGAAFVVGFLLHDLFPARIASGAQAIIIGTCFAIGAFFLLVHVVALIIPAVTVATRGRKAAEYEWRRLWWIK